MRNQALLATILLLFSSAAFGQSYEMTIHLSGGGTVTIPNDEIRRIEFVHITGMPDLGSPGQEPVVFQVLQNYPNPCSPSTTITYEIPNEADVSVRIYNLHGALIKELLHETQPAGRHLVNWDGTDSKHTRVSSWVYFYTVECGDRAFSHKLILVK